MWNSWVDREVISEIRGNVKKYIDWFYLKSHKQPKDRDRMVNEELYTSLVYLDYSTSQKLEIYQKVDRINARLQKKDITTVLTTISEDQTKKPKILESIKNVEKFVKKLKTILLDKDIKKEELSKYLGGELDGIFKANSRSKYFRRTMQDFYILWYAINEINSEMVNFRRLEIKTDIRPIFKYMKNIPSNVVSNNMGYEEFQKLIDNFKNKYRKDKRKIKLSETEKLQLKETQGNRCAISGAPIFEGDDLEVDHNRPLAIGGKDSEDNLQIAHKNANRTKGAKPRHSSE